MHKAKAADSKQKTETETETETPKTETCKKETATTKARESNHKKQSEEQQGLNSQKCPGLSSVQSVKQIFTAEAGNTLKKAFKSVSHFPQALDWKWKYK